MSKNILAFSPLFRHTGSSGCSECPIGHHCPTEKLVYPIPCQVGKYQPQKTQTSCLECPEGRSSLLCFLGQNNHECIQTEVLGYSLICSLIRSRCSLVRLLAHVAHSLAHGTVIDWMAIYSVFFSILDHSALSRARQAPRQSTCNPAFPLSFLQMQPLLISFTRLFFFGV